MGTPDLDYRIRNLRMINMRGLLLILSLVGLGAWVLAPGVVPSPPRPRLGGRPAAQAKAPGPDVADDPDDERAERMARARQTFVNNCLICHSEELTTASRLTRKQWATEVEKMIGWGSPVPEDERPALFEFL